jgi:PKD repeat protein
MKRIINIITVAAGLLMMPLSSCEDEAAIPEVPDIHTVIISQNSLALMPEDVRTLTAKFNSVATVQKGFQWANSNPSVVGIEVNETDYSCKVTALTPGESTITLASLDGTVSAACQAVVDWTEIVVDFEASKVGAVDTDVITFTDKTAGFPNAWHWTFTPQSGAPLTSTEQNPQMTFSEGTYTVTLAASNPKYSGTLTKTNYLTVLDPTKVLANFSCDYTATYAGGHITFSNQSAGTVDSWTWTFEGGTPANSTAQNPVVTYSTPGRYRATLQARNAFNTSTKEIDILVIPNFGNQLTAFFPFNNSLNDAGPFKLISSLTNGTATVVTHNGNDRKNVTGNVAVFNGTGGLILNNATSFDFGKGDFSVAVWINSSATNGTNRKQMMIWMEGGFGSGDLQTWLRLYSNASRNITMNVEKGGTIHIASAVAGSSIADGTWHHVVCTRDAAGTKMYLDGVQIGSAATAAGPGDTMNPNCQLFKIGVQQTATSWSNPFDGMLDDLIVYKKALTLTEVQELYNL